MQAKGYAEGYGLLFAYSTNGHAIVEFDFTNQEQQSLTAFPSPEDLHRRYRDYLADTPPPPVVGTVHPDAKPYCGPWSDWVYKQRKHRFDDLADLAWKKAWYFKNRLNDRATAGALHKLGHAAKKQDIAATLEGLRRWAHLIDNQAQYELGYRG